VSESLIFSNLHYFAAGATLFGTDAQGAYEFDGQSYNGRNKHVEGFDQYLACHDEHALEVKIEGCTTCQANVSSEEDLETIRMTEGDFDGDGDDTEGIAGEIETANEAFYTAMQEYAVNTIGTGIVFEPHSYPYFFTNTNGNGEVDEDEAVYANAYATWTPSLLRAAYNYQWVDKDPGAFVHKGLYIKQILYDSLNEVGSDVSGMTRPEIKTYE